MLDTKTISNRTIRRAINTPVTDGLQSLSSSSSYPAYMDNYLKEVIEQVEEETATILLTTGMDVYTNVDKMLKRNFGISTIQMNMSIIQMMNCK